MKYGKFKYENVIYWFPSKVLQRLNNINQNKYKICPLFFDNAHENEREDHYYIHTYFYNIEKQKVSNIMYKSIFCNYLGLYN